MALDPEGLQSLLRARTCSFFAGEVTQGTRLVLVPTRSSYVHLFPTDIPVFVTTNPHEANHFAGSKGPCSLSGADGQSSLLLQGCDVQTQRSGVIALHHSHDERGRATMNVGAGPGLVFKQLGIHGHR